jgi:hypothetical protein
MGGLSPQHLFGIRSSISDRDLFDIFPYDCILIIGTIISLVMGEQHEVQTEQTARKIAGVA